MTPGSSRTASDQIFAQLMREILSGILRPRDQLSERALVERFGASRTPVREAVKRLLERGLLTAGRRGVAVVRDIDQREVEELYAVRLKLEAWAARRTVGVGDIRAQTEQVILNMQKILLAEGGDHRDLVKVTVFVTDMRHFDVISEVRRRYFMGDLPASTIVEVSKLAQPDLMIEIE